MIGKGPSLQKKYAEYWSGDPAFEQRPQRGPDQSDAEHEKHVNEYEAKLKRCRETGDWTDLRVDGGPMPTAFILRPMPGSALRRIVDLAQRDKIGPVVVVQLAFRVCLMEIENGGDHQIKRGMVRVRINEDTEVDVGEGVTEATADYLDSFSQTIVSEIGDVILGRGTQGLPPKS